MIIVTADDIRVLAQSTEEDAVLVVQGERLQVLPRARVNPGEEIVYSRARLREQWGDEVTDIEAQLLAGQLSALRPGAGPGDAEPGPDEGPAPGGAAGTAQPIG